jgi:hypothetical protein
MERVPVESKAIASIGYDAPAERLEVEFRTGSIYTYENVPRSVYEWFLRIPGKGSFVTRVLEPQYRGQLKPAPPLPEVDLIAALQASLSDPERT